MAIPSKNADLYRRIKFYGFGLVLGFILVGSVLTKNKGCQTPTSAKLDEISSKTLVYCNDSSCYITQAEIVELIGVWKTGTEQTVGKGKVNFDNSDPRAEHHPNPTFEVKGIIASGKNLRIEIAVIDSIAKVVKAIDLKMPNDSCVCK